MRTRINSHKFKTMLSLCKPIKVSRHAKNCSILSKSFSSHVSIDNPYTGELFSSIEYMDDQHISSILDANQQAFQSWKHSSLSERKALCSAFVQEFAQPSNKLESATRISQAMGKPLAQALGEVDTMLHRAQTMIDVCEEALSPLSFPDTLLETEGKTLRRKVVREPKGQVLLLNPWNYPLVCAINVLVPAILAGNSVLLKHADRTAFCAHDLARAFERAGAPHHLVSALTMDHPAVHRLVAGHPHLAHVSFTGSVSGGAAVFRSVSERTHSFLDLGLELGGKDPAYVSEKGRAGAAAAALVDGAMYNAGQSCCAVERVYVHEQVYDEFMAAAAENVNAYVLGDPLSSETSMGPLAQLQGVTKLEEHVEDAVGQGADLVCGGKRTSDGSGKGRFFSPTLLGECTHSMAVMKEESFGPLLPVMRVRSAEHALELMNDSAFGLTASVWTEDEQEAERMARDLECGTVFMNRSDYVDPLLAWSGRKESGKGISLSQHGFDALTITKSYNFKVPNRT